MAENILLEHISLQLDEILHHPEFIALENKIRGLHYLIHQLELNDLLRVRILNVDTEALSKDVIKAMDYDQSKLFKKVYDNEIGTYGGLPYSIMIFDHYFSSDLFSVTFMTAMIKVLAVAHCPCISAVSSKMFNMESFRELESDAIVNIILAKVMSGAGKDAFNNLRNTDDSKYMTLVLPRVLARSPYHETNNPADDIKYNESVDPENDNHFVYMNPAFVLGALIGQAFSNFGWTAAIRGTNTGGRIDGLPQFTYMKNGKLVLKCPTEVELSDKKEFELANFGFTCLCSCKGTTSATFFGVPTINKPTKYDDVDATANARITSSLQCVSVVCRIVHSIVITFRNLIGSAETPQDIEDLLNTNYNSLVLANPTGATAEQKATMPLKAFSVKIVENPAAPGHYSAIIHVAPHSFLDQVDVSIRSVARLPKME